jgi:hypothetical protein
MPLKKNTCPSLIWSKTRIIAAERRKGFSPSPICRKTYRYAND